MQAAGRGLSAASGELSARVGSLVPSGWSGHPADAFTSDWGGKAGRAGDLAAVCGHVGGVLVDLGDAIDAANQQAASAAGSPGGGRAAALNGPSPAQVQAQQQKLSRAAGGAAQARAAARAKLAGVAVPRIGPPLASSQVTAWAKHLAPPPETAPSRPWYDSVGSFFSDTVVHGGAHLLSGAGHVAGDVVDGAGHFAEGFLWDGAVGVLRGLGDLAGMGPLWGDPSFLQTWHGLYEVAAPLADPSLLLTHPQMAQADLAFGKSLLAWDEWGKDPARAAGNVVFNVVTAPFVASKVLDAGTAAKAAADAGQAGADVSGAGKAGTAAKAAGDSSGAAKTGPALANDASTGKAAAGSAGPATVIDLPPGVRDVIGNLGFRATAADRAAFLKSHYIDRFADEHLRNLMQKPELSGIDRADLAAGSNYTGEAGNVINRFLRNGVVSDLRFRGLDIHDVRLTVSAFNQLPKWEGWVSRTMDRAPAQAADIASKYRTGQVVTEPGFTSASKTARLAGNLKFWIYAKNFRDVEALSYQGVEQEVAAIPGTAFKVLDKFQDPEGTWHIKMIEVTGG